jgi:tape measure domain-containing protein
MATETLRIVVTINGDRVVKQRLKGVGNEARKTTSAVQMMKRGLQLLAGSFVIRELGGMADAMTNVRNRVSIFTKDATEANAVIGKLFEVANKTRTSFEATAKVYARMALATSDLGLSQQDLITFQERLNKATIVSGARTQEANAAMIQLSQGLAAGALRGDELRSVLEQLPFVADVIARGMGKTRGELKKMGEAGQITSKAILEAFEKMDDEINEKFGKTVPTLAQSFEIAKNHALAFIDALNSATGVTGAIGQLLVFLGQHLNSIVTLLGILIAKPAFKLIAKGITLAIGKLRIFLRLLLTSPLALLTTIAALFVSFGQNLEIAGTFGGTLGDVLKETFIEIKQTIKEVVGAIRLLFSDMAKDIDAAFGTVFGDVTFTLENVLAFVATFADSAIKILVFVGSVIGETFAFIAAKFIRFWIDIVNTLIGWLNKLVNKAREVGRIVKNTAVEMGESFDEAVSDIFGFPQEAKRKIKPKELFEAIVSDDTKKFAALTGIDIGTAMAEGAGQGMNNLIPKIPTFVEGASDIYKQGLKEHFAELTSGEAGFFATFIGNVFNRVKANAIRGAKDVDLTGAEKDKDKDKEGDAKKLNDELQRRIDLLRDLENELFPILAAERELAEAREILHDATVLEIVSGERAIEILQAKEHALRDQLDPFGAYIEKTREEIELLGMTEEQRKRTIEFRRVEQGLVEKGIVVGIHENAVIRTLLDSKESAARVDARRVELLKLEKGILQDIRGPQQEYQNNIVALRKLLDEGTISQGEFARAMRQAKAAYLDTKFDEESGFSRGLLQIQEQIIDVASTIEDVLVGAFNGVESALVDIVQASADGELSFESLKASAKQMVDSMLADLTRLAFRQGLLLLLTGGSSAGFGGTRGSLLGFQHGGGFDVPGSGGPDSQLVAFRATPGEHVEVSHRGEGAAAPAVEPAPVNLRVVNQSDPHEMVDAMSTPTGERVIINVVRRNRAAIRRMLS